MILNITLAAGLLAAMLATPAAAQAPADTAVKVTVGGFVDGYYAWDSGRPASMDRSFAGGALFTTQPARHNEFNVNLAFVELKADGPRVRGRLALQAGTSVQSNYAGEPATGQVGGPALSRFIQEAVAGAKLADNLWVDGGIFFSHMGMESWISRDNPTYTRSLVAEYSPYYQSGVKFTWTPSDQVTAQLDVVNGWQNISENNSGKGVGARVDWAPVEGTTLSYYNFLSDESGSQLRTFNGVGARVVRGAWTLMGQADAGRQAHAATSSSSWYGLMALARYQVSPVAAINGRLERFVDDDQVVLATGSVGATANPAFHGHGASFGIDVAASSRALWRTELRGFGNRGAVFPNGTSAARSTGGFAVTSLAVTF
ncbi:MAG: porin [Gemmatimonadaceae bacterium]